MRPGRKRRAKPVTLPGKVTLADIERAEKAERMKETTVVLMQPHRRGSNATECASALGRFWLQHKFDRLLLQAGEEYAGLVRRWRACWGMKEGAGASDGAATGLGPSEATVRAWRTQIDRIEERLNQVSPTVRFAIARLVIDDRDLLLQSAGDAKLGLRVLAVELGICKPDHPFR